MIPPVAPFIMSSQDVIDREAPSESPEASATPLPRRRLSLRTRWAIGRARYSPAGLLARLDERKAISLFAAVNGGLAILAIGFFSWVTNLPLMFPALGPTAYILYLRAEVGFRCAAVSHSRPLLGDGGRLGGLASRERVVRSAGFHPDRRTGTRRERDAGSCRNVRAPDPPVLLSPAFMREQFDRRPRRRNDLARRAAHGRRRRLDSHASGSHKPIRRRTRAHLVTDLHDRPRRGVMADVENLHIGNTLRMCGSNREKTA